MREPNRDPAAARFSPSGDGGNGRVVLFCGGSRGVGTSTLAALFALVASGEQQKVLLVQAEGREDLQTLFRAGSREDAAGGLTWPLPTLALMPTTGDYGNGSLASLLSSLRSHFALIVVDGGHRLEAAREVASGGVDHLLCVTSEDEVASAGAYALFKALTSQAPGLPAGVLVNRSPSWGGSGTGRRVRTAIDRFLHRDLTILMDVPLDECLRVGVGAGMPLHEAAPGSPAARTLYEIVQILRFVPDTSSPEVYAPRPLEGRNL